jgi:hypothetical protein
MVLLMAEAIKAPLVKEQLSSMMTFFTTAFSIF